MECEKLAKGEEGARERLREELGAVRSQIVCRDFKPHLGNCRFMRSRCKFFPCNRLSDETRIVLRDLALEEERKERMQAWQQGGKGRGGRSEAGTSGGGGKGVRGGGSKGGW
eukprot:582987-Pleurochrysis_carterae.AAC.1